MVSIGRQGMQGIPEADVAWLYELAGKIGAESGRHVTVNELAHLAINSPSSFANLATAHKMEPPPQTIPSVGARLGSLVAPPATPADTGYSQGDKGRAPADARPSPIAGGGTVGSSNYDRSKDEGLDPWGGKKPTATNESTTTGADTGDVSSADQPEPPPRVDYAGFAKDLSGVRAPQKPGYMPPVGLPYHPAIPTTNPVGEMLAAFAQRQQQPSLRSEIG